MLRVVGIGLVALASLYSPSRGNAFPAPPPKPGLKAEEGKKESKKSILEIYKTCIKNYSSTRFAVWNAPMKELATRTNELLAEGKYEDFPELMSLINKELIRLADIKDPNKRSEIFQLERSLGNITDIISDDLFVAWLNTNNILYNHDMGEILLRRYRVKEKNDPQKEAECFILIEALKERIPLSPLNLENLAKKYPEKTMKLVKENPGYIPDTQLHLLSLSTAPELQAIKEAVQEEINRRNSYPEDP